MRRDAPAWRFVRRIAAAALCLVLHGIVSDASAATVQPRAILGLYKSTEGMSAQRNEITLMLEPLLNDLGLVVRYHDISQGLPSDDELDGALGIVTWYTSADMPDALGYLNWLVRQVEAGRKVVVFDSLGAFQDAATKQEVDWREVERAFDALGIGIDPALTPDQMQPIALSDANDPHLMAFEVPIAPEELKFYQRVFAAYPNSRPFLTIRLRNVPDTDSQMIVATPHGGVALAYLYQEDPTKQLRRWHLNAPRFLEAALGVEGTPRMDLSVLNGRRLWFMHVDGDGFTTPSRVESGKSCAAVFDRYIVQWYKLPMTLSVIVAEIDPAYLGNEMVRALARRVFAHPLVQVASHSFSHPHDWQQRILDLTVPYYQFDLHRELEESIKYVQEELAPPGKLVRLLLATGSANVPVEGVKRLAALGVRVLNSDDHARMDHVLPSLTGLTPATLQADGVVQYAHRAANDFIMTERWTRVDGYQDILETFQRTASPRPLLPINVYVHWYIAQTMESLKSLRRVIDWCLTQPIAPVWASTYLDIVDGFRAATISRDGESAWIVEGNGLCRTVRFDAPQPRGVLDLQRSEGVLGSAVWGESLYVFLDAAARHRIVFGNEEGDEVRLLEANCLVHSIASDGEGWRIEAEAPADGLIVIGPVPPNRPYVVAIRDGGERPARRIVAQSDLRGRLEIRAPLSGARSLHIAQGNAIDWLTWRIKQVALLGVVAVLVLLFLIRVRLRVEARRSGR